MTRWRRALAVLGAVALVAAAPAATAAAQDAGDGGDDRGGCPVLAAAWGLQATVDQSDSLILGSPTGPGVPVAQACVDYGVKDSQAFASSPYPGESVRTLPGAVGGQMGQEFPDYPAYAGSRYPANKKSTVDEPGMALRAKSSETASSGRARSALDPDSRSVSTLATADSSVDPDARTSEAIARADLQPLTVNGVLSLGEIVSHASAKYTKGGAVKRDSDLSIGRTTVAGQEVEITPDGVRVAGQTAPLPGTGSVTEQLEKAGITLRYLAPQKTRNGIVSPGVELVVRNQDPGSGTTTTFRYLLGRSYAKAGPVETPDGGLDLGAPPAPVGPPVSGSGGEGSVSSGGAPAGGAEPAPADDAPAPDNAPPAPDVAPEPGPEPAMALAGHPVDLGLGAAYLVIVLGALAMFVNGTLVRLLGVKTRWTS